MSHHTIVSRQGALDPKRGDIKQHESQYKNNKYLPVRLWEAMTGKTPEKGKERASRRVRVLPPPSVFFALSTSSSHYKSGLERENGKGPHSNFDPLCPWIESQSPSFDPKGGVVAVDDDDDDDDDSV